MNRIILDALKDGAKILNITKYGWFSYFYFGHRTCRYLLWLAHALVLITSIINAKSSWFYRLVFVGQAIFYVVATVNYFIKSKNRFVNMITYYSMTILAQWKGVINCITGKAKPIWDKAESTR